jgi:hypothetical protein
VLQPCQQCKLLVVPKHGLAAVTCNSMDMHRQEQTRPLAVSIGAKRAIWGIFNSAPSQQIATRTGRKKLKAGWRVTHFEVVSADQLLRLHMHASFSIPNPQPGWQPLTCIKPPQASHLGKSPGNITTQLLQQLQLHQASQLQQRLQRYIVLQCIIQADGSEPWAATHHLLKDPAVQGG